VLNEEFGDDGRARRVIITQYPTYGAHALPAYGCLVAFANPFCGKDEGRSVFARSLDSHL